MKKTRAAASPKKRPAKKPPRRAEARKPNAPTVKRLAAIAAEVCQYPAIEHRLVLNALEHLAEADYDLERAAAVYAPTSKEIAGLRADVLAAISQVKSFAARNEETGIKEGWLK